MDSFQKTFFFLVAFLSQSFLWANISVEADGSVLLPLQKQESKGLKRDRQMELTASSEWQEFTRQNGTWSVLWNEIQANPHRAFGKPIRIPGYSSIRSDNIEAASQKFLELYSGLLKINSSQLKLVRKDFLRKTWYVTYFQVYQEIPVLFSEVDLRISDQGEVVALGSDFFSEIDIITIPKISIQTAREKAKIGLQFNPGTDTVSEEAKLLILPVETSNEIQYHLTYQFNIFTTSPVGNYFVLVDAIDGTVLWRLNKVRYSNISIFSGGMVQLEQPTDPFIEKKFFNQYFTVGGIPMVTDSSGTIRVSVNVDQEVSAGLRGPFVEVRRMDGPDAYFTKILSPGDSIRILWEDLNSHPAERDAFYHTNLAHDFVTSVDPDFTRINYSMPCAVNINQTCNAFWDGEGINFYRAGEGCQNTAQIPSVVYHEYGHGVNDKLYEQLGASLGMVNGAVHEGMADVFAALLEDEPQVGRGFTGTDSYLRNLENTNSYPQDNSGEVHYDGLIIGGAFWEIRKQLGRDAAIYLSHYAKYGLPDDLDNGIAFAEWYLETLIADDKDGNLDNGTPHYEEINSAFNLHGIGSSLFMRLSFKHEPLVDTQDIINNYPVSFMLEAAPIQNSIPDSVYLHYSVNQFKTMISIPALSSDGINYFAEIPGQPLGTRVEYFISAYDELGGISLTFPADAPQSDVYSFLVGFQSITLDNFETEAGWQIGDSDDQATTGVWERAIPFKTTIDGTTVQPDKDFSETGDFCFVTQAAAGSDAGSFDVDGGKTTLFSPVLDLSGMARPVIKYYKWYSNDKGASPGQDVWQVDISGDSGLTWINVESTKRSTKGWEKVQFFVEDYIVPLKSVQMRFTASDFEPGSLVEALIDDFELLAASMITPLNDKTLVSLPTKFDLYQNYPNPFNPMTTIRYQVPHPSKIKLIIYNMLGQQVMVLENEVMPAGYFQAKWDGKDYRGNLLPSGVYFYEMKTGEFYQVRKMILMH